MARPRNSLMDSTQSVKIASDLVIALRVVAATQRVPVQILIDRLLRAPVERMKKEAIEQLAS